MAFKSSTYGSQGGDNWALIGALVCIMLPPVGICVLLGFLSWKKFGKDILEMSGTVARRRNVPYAPLSVDAMQPNHRSPSDR